LIYAVCTLTRRETTAVAEAFEKDNPEFEPWVVRNPLAPEVELSPRMWLWPQDVGGNGMFVAAWRRRAES